jgi:RTX calcium-binding nonapeptide repeat (4 copies)
MAAPATTPISSTIVGDTIVRERERGYRYCHDDAGLLHVGPTSSSSSLPAAETSKEPATLANTITGGADTNTLNGGAGNDVPVAGLHAALTGGTGNDRIGFTVAGTVAAPDTNTIADFVHAADRISFHDAGFNRGVAESTGTAVLKALPSALVSPNTDGSFAAAGNRFAYDIGSGSLYYDADGSGAGERQLVATLTDHASLTSTDLFFVA